jgi:hypothetical protein
MISPGGFAPLSDIEQMLKRAGWTKRDIDRARLLASLPEETIPAMLKSERESRARRASIRPSLFEAT